MKGDFVAHLEKPRSLMRIEGQPLNQKHYDLNQEVLQIMEDFSRVISNKGGRVMVAWPSLPVEVYDFRSDWIQRIFSAIACKKIVLCGNPSEYVLPIDDFFDTIYHLNAEGRRRHTERVLNYILSVTQVAM